jgi:hypothetical protein
MSSLTWATLADKRPSIRIECATDNDTDEDSVCSEPPTPTRPKPRASRNSLRQAAYSCAKEEDVDTASRDSKPIKSKYAKFSDWSIEDLLNAIVPTDIHERLHENKYRCVATLGVSNMPENPQRCDHRHNRSAITAEAALEGLCKLKSGTEEKILGKMEIIFRSSMCGSHINVSTRTRYALIDRLGSGTHVKEMRTWVRKVAEAATSMAKKTEPSLPKDSKTAPAKQSEPLRFEAYQPPKNASDYVELALHKLAITDLSPKLDRKAGFIYIYWLKPDLRRIKIGHSVREDPDKRLLEQIKRCGKEYEFHESSPHAITLPHAHRVEKLIHAELMGYRKVTKCDSCLNKKGSPRSHDEWFDIKIALVLEVYQKWKRWILTHPYGDDGILKPDALRSLGEVCKPVEVPKEPILPCRKEETTVKQIGRRVRKATEDVVRERRKGGITVPSRAASAVVCC